MKEVKSLIDLQNIDDAQQWASEVMEKRPYRTEVFKLFSKKLKELDAKNVLELGSGPGFLAEHLLKFDNQLNYTAFDFSNAMHSLAKDRVGEGFNINFVTGSFAHAGWSENLKKYDAVVSLQAIHEVRHKAKTKDLFVELRALLADHGTFLYCDHVCDENGMKNSELYMNEPEQLETLQLAGFRHIEKILRIGSLCFWEAKK